MFTLQAKLIGLGVLLALLTSALAWHKIVVTQRDTWQQAALTSEAAFASERASFAAEKANRDTERTSDQTAVSEAATACDQRVAEARRSASVIRTIVEKPVASDPITHCPVADLVGADELRSALEHPSAR